MTHPYLAPPNNSLALASAILGVLTCAVAFLLGVIGQPTFPKFVLVFVVTFVPGLLTVIFGFIGISTANRLGGKRRRLAVTGVVYGFAPIPIYWVAIVLHTLVAG